MDRRPLARPANDEARHAKRRGPVLAFAPRLAWLVLLLLFGISATPPRAVFGQVDPEQEDLGALISEALSRHPRMKAAEARYAAASALPPQAGSLPDPVLGLKAVNLRVDDVALDSSPMAGLELSFQQGLLFPGKRGRRRSVAEAIEQTEFTRTELVAAETRARVESAYWHYAMADRVEQITRENITVLEQIVDMAHSRFAVGGGAQQDILQAQSTLAELGAQLLQRAQETSTAGKALNTAVGRAPNGHLGTASPAPLDSIRLNADEISRLSSEASPSIRVQMSLVERGRSALEEAKHDRWPNVGLAAGYRFRDPAGDTTDGADMFFLALNRRVQQEASQLTEAIAEEMDERLSVGLSVETLLDEIRRLRNQTLMYVDQVLPQDELALEASLSDYSVARVGFLSILENWQRLLRDRITVEALRAQRGSRMAALRALIGKELQ
jgi:outer membrane protein TolC